MPNLNKTDRKIINDTNVAIPTYYFEPKILNTVAESDGIHLAGYNVIGILFPAAIDGATMTVQVSFDGNTWKDLTGVSFVITADEALEVDTTTVYGWSHIRFVTNIVQTADRTLTIVVKEV